MRQPPPMRLEWKPCHPVTYIAIALSPLVFAAAVWLWVIQ